jgi:hypothetical protein
MKVEEKIARAYHRDLSWRKVLVRLEPDAHNNIIVRRMFANAYGWPVVKHLCDTHFADTHAARTRDEDEPARERAKPMDQPVDPMRGEHVHDQTAKKGEPRPRTKSETREARDELVDLEVPQEGVERSASNRGAPSSAAVRRDSEVWDDSFFEETDDGEDSDAVDERNLVSRILNPNYAIAKKQESEEGKKSASQLETPAKSKGYTDGHRGLAPMSPITTTTPRSPREKERMRSRQSDVSAPPPPFKAATATRDIEIQTPAPVVLTDHLQKGLVAEPESLGNSPVDPAGSGSLGGGGAGGGAGSLAGKLMADGGPVSPGSVAADVGLRKSGGGV